MKYSRHLLLLLGLMAVGAATPIAFASAAAAPIERVWSFNGGEVAIQSQGANFVGTVVGPTRFALCSHPVGEQMWTDVRPQPDGSYWGLHQWFFETAECIHNPALGPTAWRVMESAGGGHYLLVCFSNPGGTQPTIASNGATANVTYGCRQSAEVAPVPVQVAAASSAGVQSFAQAVKLPSVEKCFSRRDFEIHLQDPRHDPMKEVVVRIGGRRVVVVRRHNVFAATINLRGLPSGAFTVKIRATTVLGHHLYGSRTYHTCVKKAVKLTRPKPLRPRRRS